MATIVAAAGGGDWNTGASWVGGVAPTAADDAQIVLASGAMSIGTGAVCRSADFSTYTGTLSGTGTLTIGDATAGLSNIALKLVSGMTVTGPPVFSFISTSATVQTVDFAGKTTGNVTFNAASNGSWKMNGAHTIGTAGVLTLTKGTLDVNGQTVSWGKFDMNNANTKSLTLGAADISITAGAFADDWFYGSGGSTLSAASSTIRMTGNNSQFRSAGGTYGTLIFTGSGINKISDSAAQTFATLTITGTANKTDSFQTTSSITISGTFTVNSNSSINRVLVYTSAAGTSKTITAATVVLGNIVDFMDITGAGAATWTVAGTGATALGDAGGNSGITFTTPASQTWSGTSGGNWSTNAWTSRVPLPQDDVTISSAFSASQTVTADMPRLGKSINFTGTTGNPLFSTGGTIYGNLTFISDMSTTNVGMVFAGRSSYTITTSGKLLGNAIRITAPSGTYTLQDDFNTASNIFIDNGTFDSNSKNITCLSFACTNTNTRTVTLGTSTINITTVAAAANTVNFGTTTGLTYGATNTTFVIANATANSRNFVGGGLTHGTLTYTVAGSTGSLKITGENTFYAINFSDVTNARSLLFTAGTTTTITNSFNVQGTSGKLMTVDSITAATHTLSKVASGVVDCDYLSVKNSIAQGGASWFAGDNSTNVSGNTGWIFTKSPNMFLTF